MDNISARFLHLPERIRYVKQMRSINKFYMKKKFIIFYINIMKKFMKELDEKELKRSSIVFAPHPDDETLGCGGTIIKKKKKGANIKIVIMTDGRRSHPNLISEDRLKNIREKETLYAINVMGLSGEDVIFLEFKDGELLENHIPAIEKVKEIMLSLKPEEIFIPYYREPASWSKDHVATNMIVTSASRHCHERILVNEYPIGFWYRWLLSDHVQVKHLGDVMGILKNGFSSSLYFLKDFRCSVWIKEYLEEKKVALDQHVSQMTKLIPSPMWKTLTDVLNGEFLNFFFQEHEIFHRYIIDRTNRKYVDIKY